LDIGIRNNRLAWSIFPHPKKSIFVIDWQGLPVDSMLIKLFLPETLLMFFGQNFKQNLNGKH